LRAIFVQHLGCYASVVYEQQLAKIGLLNILKTSTYVSVISQLTTVGTHYLANQCLAF
jgi:hypothetical protein